MDLVSDPRSRMRPDSHSKVRAAHSGATSANPAAVTGAKISVSQGQKSSHQCDLSHMFSVQVSWKLGYIFPYTGRTAELFRAVDPWPGGSGAKSNTEVESHRVVVH